MKPVFIFLILASIATLSLAVPVLILDGKKAALESVSSTDAVETHQSTYVQSLSSAPLSVSDANEIASDVQTSVSAHTGNSQAILVKGWWFKVAKFTGTAGSQNIMTACAAIGMESPCGHTSYVQHGGGCVPVQGFDGHWSIAQYVQAWGQSSELTSMFNHKYIFVGLGQYKDYSHYNDASSHASGGILNGQTYKNPGSGETVCMSKTQPHSSVVVQGWRFQTFDFKGVAGSENFMQTCRAQGMEAPCNHPSYINHGGGCIVIPGMTGHWSIEAHVQAWGQSEALTLMMRHKYFFVGLGQYRQYSHYNTASSHEGAGMHPPGTPTARNPDGGQTVCVAPVDETVGPSMQFRGWWWITVDFKGIAGSQNILSTCQRLGLEAVCDHPSHINHGGGCTAFNDFQGHLSYEPQLKPWANNDEFNKLMHHKFFFVGLGQYHQYSHYNTAGSHQAAGMHPPGTATARNPDGGQTICISKNEYKPRPTCQVSNFGPWSPCSKSCGGGIQTRSRTVTKDGSQCPTLREEKTCHAEECHTATADIGKTVLAALQANLQKLTTTNNNLKADSDRTASLAAAAKTLFEEASNDMATKKANMENAMTAHAAAKKKCSADSDESVTANAVQADAVKTNKDSEVIDKELALIAQLKAKLTEVIRKLRLVLPNLIRSC
jgi:hypothetical protein